jgi:hypothetical protein
MSAAQPRGIAGDSAGMKKTPDELRALGRRLGNMGNDGDDAPELYSQAMNAVGELIDAMKDIDRLKQELAELQETVAGIRSWGQHNYDGRVAAVKEAKNRKVLAERTAAAQNVLVQRVQGACDCGGSGFVHRVPGDQSPQRPRHDADHAHPPDAQPAGARMTIIRQMLNQLVPA